MCGAALVFDRRFYESDKIDFREPKRIVVITEMHRAPTERNNESEKSERVALQVISTIVGARYRIHIAMQIPFSRVFFFIISICCWRSYSSALLLFGVRPFCGSRFSLTQYEQKCVYIGSDFYCRIVLMTLYFNHRIDSLLFASFLLLASPVSPSFPAITASFWLSRTTHSRAEHTAAIHSAIVIFSQLTFLLL